MRLFHGDDTIIAATILRSIIVVPAVVLIPAFATLNIYAMGSLGTPGNRMLHIQQA